MYKQIYLNTKYAYLQLTGGHNDNNIYINQLNKRLQLLSTQKFFTVEEFFELCDILEKTKSSFVDNYFPSSSKIQFSNEHKIVEYKASDPQAKLFLEDPEPDDIFQGFLGDCYLLAALCSIAKLPENIKNLFMNNIDQQDSLGIYGVKFYIGGEIKIIVVNNQLPVYNNTLLVAQSFPKGNLWVPIIEKAFAKLHNSYDHIQGSFSSYAFTLLTGAPCITFDSYSNININNILIENIKKKFFLTCSFSEKIYNLYDRHEYSIQNVVDVNNNNTKKILFQLKNPHRHEKWYGNWSSKLKKYFELPPDMKKSMELEINQKIKMINAPIVNQYQVANSANNAHIESQEDLDKTNIESQEDLNKTNIGSLEDLDKTNIDSLEDLDKINIMNESTDRNNIMKNSTANVFFVNSNNEIQPTNYVRSAIELIKNKYYDIVYKKALSNIEQIKNDVNANISDEDLKILLNNYHQRLNNNDWDRKSEYQINANVYPQLQRLFKEGGNMFQYGVDYGRTGIFYMSSEDFLNKYRYVDVCYYNKIYKLSSSNKIIFTLPDITANVEKSLDIIFTANRGYYYIYYTSIHPLVADTTKKHINNFTGLINTHYDLNILDIKVKDHPIVVRNYFFSAIEGYFQSGVFRINIRALNNRNKIAHDQNHEEVYLHVYGEYPAQFIYN